MSQTSEVLADLNHVVASNSDKSIRDCTKLNNPILNHFANIKSEQINRSLDTNNYFEQREKEFNHREAQLIRKENAFAKVQLAAGELSPEGSADYPGENKWLSVEPNPLKKSFANDVR